MTITIFENLTLRLTILGTLVAGRATEGEGQRRMLELLLQRQERMARIVNIIKLSPPKKEETKAYKLLLLRITA
jgi:hypothetical protein